MSTYLNNEYNLQYVKKQQKVDDGNKTKRRMSVIIFTAQTYKVGRKRAQFLHINNFIKE